MDVVREELKKLIPGCAILTAIMLIICAPAGIFSSRLLLGALFSYVYSLLYFYMQGVSVVKALQMDPEQARKYMPAQYFLRYFITAVVLFVALKAKLHILGVVLPLFFPKLVILFHHVFKKKVGKKNDRT